MTDQLKQVQLFKTRIELFNKTFNGENLDEEKKKMFKSLKKPEICDSLESVQFAMYKEDETQKKARRFKEILYEAIDESAKSQTNLKNNSKNKVIQEFVKYFKTEMMRAPTKQEIMNNLHSSALNIETKDIDTFINTHKKLFEKVKPTMMVESTLGDIEMGGNIDNTESQENSDSDEEDNDHNGMHNQATRY